MTLCKPPERYDGTPRRYRLRAGTTLWRVHGQKREAWSFNPVPSDPYFGGGRFDATKDDEYPYYYAGLDAATAVAETMLRGLASDETGKRTVKWLAREGKRASCLVLTRDLNLVSLVSGEDLGAIGQDAWLVTSSARDYAQTRAWAHWLRVQALWAQGFAWPSLRDPGRHAVVLFGDRCTADFGPGYERTLLHEVPELAVDLDTEIGCEWLRDLLRPYRVTIPDPCT